MQVGTTKDERLPVQSARLGRDFKEGGSSSQNIHRQYGCSVLHPTCESRPKPNRAAVARQMSWLPELEVFGGRDCHEISLSFFSLLTLFHLVIALVLFYFVSICCIAEKCYFYSLEYSIALLSVNELL